MSRPAHRRPRTARLSLLTWAALILSVAFALTGLAASTDGRHAALIIAAILGALGVVTAHDDCVRNRR